MSEDDPRCPTCKFINGHHDGCPVGQSRHVVEALRRIVITKLLEDENTSERTVIELAGHVSRKMLDTYSHIRMKKKLEGVMALERVTSGGKDPRQDPLQFPEKKLVMFEKKASEG